MHGQTHKGDSVPISVVARKLPMPNVLVELHM